MPEHFFIITNFLNYQTNVYLNCTLNLLQDGDEMEKGCEERCLCKMGEWHCDARCNGPFFKRGKKFDDPTCTEKPDPNDECCAVMVCEDMTDSNKGG